MLFQRRAVKTIKKLTNGESSIVGNTPTSRGGGNGGGEDKDGKDDRMVSCLRSMQALQTQLLAKDQALLSMLQECVSLQTELQAQVPMVEQHMKQLRTSS